MFRTPRFRATPPSLHPAHQDLDEDGGETLQEDAQKDDESAVYKASVESARAETAAREELDQKEREEEARVMQLSKDEAIAKGVPLPTSPPCPHARAHDESAGETSAGQIWR